MLLAIPEREREASRQPLERADAVLLVEVQDHLAAAGRLELVTGGHELEPELRRVRRLAVGDEPERAALVAQRLQHRLRARPGAAAMGERDRGVVGDRQAPFQRRAPAQGVAHGTDGRRQLLPSETRSPWQDARNRPHHPSPIGQPCSGAVFAAGVAILRHPTALAASTADSVRSALPRPRPAARNPKRCQDLRVSVRRTPRRRGNTRSQSAVSDGTTLAPPSAGRGLLPFPRRSISSS